MSNAEIKNKIDEIASVFEDFKVENDARLKAIENNKNVDPILEEKISKMNNSISELDSIKTKMEEMEAATKTVKAKASEMTIDNAMNIVGSFAKNGINGMGDVNARLDTLTDENGGLIVPEEVEKAIDKVAQDMGGLMGICTKKTVSAPSWTKIINVGGASGGWLAEGETVPTTDNSTLKQITINAKKVYANPVATQEGLADVREAASWLLADIGDVFYDQISEALINGTGVKSPRGINSYTKVANSSYAWGSLGFIASGAAADIDDADALIDLQHALKTKYRGTAKFLMSDSAVQSIRKIKQDNRYIFQAPMAGAPAQVLGKEIVVDEYMDAIAANAFPVAYGDFAKAYTVIRRQGLSVLRNPYLSPGLVYFTSTSRLGGGVSMFEAIKFMKCSA